VSENNKPAAAPHITAIDFVPGEAISGSTRGFDKHRVRFIAIANGRKAEIPIDINFGYFEESRIVPVARDALHRFAAALAEATEHWKLPDDQRQTDYPKGFWKLPESGS